MVHKRLQQEVTEGTEGVEVSKTRWPEEVVIGFGGKLLDGVLTFVLAGENKT
jgi:hypothetical protein